MIGRLRAEIAELLRLIDQAPETDLLGAGSLTSRLDDVVVEMMHLWDGVTPLDEWLGVPMREVMGRVQQTNTHATEG